MASGLESTLESLPGGDNKIGGKSIYLYGLVIAVFTVAYLWWSGRNQTNYGTAAVTDDSLGGGFPSVSGDLGDLPKSAQPVDVSTTDEEDYRTSTNSYWETAAITWAVTQGINPLTAQVAIERYLQGEPLDYNQTQVMNKIIAHSGPPPEGVYSTPSPTDKAPTKATPAKPKYVDAAQLNWIVRTEKWVPVGANAHGYWAPNMSAQGKGTYTVGKPLITIRRAYGNGYVWAQRPTGSYIRVNDFVPYTGKQAAY